MSHNLQNFVKFKKFQLENLVDFEKCCKTHIYLQKSEPIQPKTSNILPKFCQPTPVEPREASFSPLVDSDVPARLRAVSAGLAKLADSNFEISNLLFAAQPTLALS